MAKIFPLVVENQLLVNLYDVFDRGLAKNKSRLRLAYQSWSRFIDLLVAARTRPLHLHSQRFCLDKPRMANRSRPSIFIQFSWLARFSFVTYSRLDLGSLRFWWQKAAASHRFIGSNRRLALRPGSLNHLESCAFCPPFHTDKSKSQIHLGSAAIVYGLGKYSR